MRPGTVVPLVIVLFAGAIMAVSYSAVPGRTVIKESRILEDLNGKEWIYYAQGGATHRIRFDSISAIYSSSGGRTTIYFAGGQLSSEIDPSLFETHFFKENEK